MTKVVVRFNDGTHINQPADKLFELTVNQQSYIMAMLETELVAVINIKDVNCLYLSKMKEENK